MDIVYDVLSIIVTQHTNHPIVERLLNGKLRSALLGQPEDVESACYLLNSDQPKGLCDEFRRLVTLWQKSGPNLSKMLNADPQLRMRTLHGRTHLIPSSAGRGYLMWLPQPRGLDSASDDALALAHFMDLVVNPNWNKLGGPCARCGKYFIKKTLKQKTYCSRRCGSIQTALKHTHIAREIQHKNKLEEAKRAVHKWQHSRSPIEWRQWVADQTGLTKKWLTRALNGGELEAPRAQESLYTGGIQERERAKLSSKVVGRSKTQTPSPQTAPDSFSH